MPPCPCRPWARWGARIRARARATGTGRAKVSDSPRESRHALGPRGSTTRFRLLRRRHGPLSKRKGALGRRIGPPERDLRPSTGRHRLNSSLAPSPFRTAPCLWRHGFDDLEDAMVCDLAGDGRFRDRLVRRPFESPGKERRPTRKGRCDFSPRPSCWLSPATSFGSWSAEARADRAQPRSVVEPIGLGAADGGRPRE